MFYLVDLQRHEVYTLYDVDTAPPSRRGFYEVLVRKYVLALGAVFACFLAVSGCSRSDDPQPAASARSLNPIFEKPALLATIADDEKPQSVTPAMGMGSHASLEATFQPVFSQRGGGVAYCAEKNGKVYVVHNGKPGKTYTNVGALALSPDGRRIAYGALTGGKWRMIIDGKEGELFSAVKAPVFSPDGLHVAYQAMAGEKWHLVVDAKPNAGTGTRILDHQFSGDSSRIAYIDNANDKNAGRLVVADLGFTRETTVATDVSLMTVNDDRTRIAAITGTDGKFSVCEADFSMPDKPLTGPQYERIFKLVFTRGDRSAVYMAERSGKRLVVYSGREEPIPDGGDAAEPPVLRPGHKGFGLLVKANNLAFLYESLNASPRKHKEYEEAANLVSSRDGNSWAYAARRGNTWFLVVNDAEGPAFDRIVNPVFSPDGKYVVYRARKEGKRFVVVADRDGRTVKTLPQYEQVFEVKFSDSGKLFGYGVKDGKNLIWKVESL